LLLLVVVVEVEVEVAQVAILKKQDILCFQAQITPLLLALVDQQEATL
jgi:hypothetical protein